MSREVDERVVQMQFDNAQFERGTRQTMGTLEKLKQWPWQPRRLLRLLRFLLRRRPRTTLRVQVRKQM